VAESNLTTRLSQGVTVLLGAALLFQIQPVVGKLLLPWYGGAASVWATCIFYFQIMLLAGYTYAHFLSAALRARTQVLVHSGLIVFSLTILPISMNNAAPWLPDELPAIRILLSLTVSIGVPIFVLASTAPLIQSWSTVIAPTHSVYRLYSISNIGALVALASYPFLLEPNLSLRAQTNVWSLLYAGYAISTLLVSRDLWLSNDSIRNRNRDSENTKQASPGSAVLITLLSAGGVVALLSVTNLVTQNTSSIPFLWILPLSLYLLSYIICFAGENWYSRGIWSWFFFIALILSPILYFFGTYFEMMSVLACFMLVLFSACMICHGELHKLRPEATELTRYYLLIAVGGALGGGSVSILAPLVFDRFLEFPIGLYVVYLVLGSITLLGIRKTRGIPGPQVDADSSSERMRFVRFTGVSIALVAGAVVFPAVFVYLDHHLARSDIFRTRNFYGVLTVKELERNGTSERILVDGTTIHGIQKIGNENRSVPTGYYREGTGVDIAMAQAGSVGERRRIGIIGLGAGTISAYGRKGDEIRYYELNPSVVDVAHRYFSFIQQSEAKIDIVTGDARVSMQKELDNEERRQYDILVIDAFSSDSIPSHLLTREAFEVYWAHLKPAGTLAIHTSNNYFDLAPPISNLAKKFRKEAVLVSTSRRNDGSELRANWILIADSGKRFLRERIKGSKISPLIPNSNRLWTDDYCDLLGALK
jgi:hypothetical protein